MAQSIETIRTVCEITLREIIAGGDLLEPPVEGYRRKPPMKGAQIEDIGDTPTQAPMPELDGVLVTLHTANGPVPAVVADFIPIENALVEVAGPDAIHIEFVICTDYPPEILAHLVDAAAVGAQRVVSAASDARFSLWIDEILDILYHELDEEALGVDFDVDMRSGSFEELQAAGVLLS